jgi:ribosome-associated toxin RatA of RatAB toxin-antitoxin module
MALFRFTKRAASNLAAEPALIYDILDDYDSYAEWMPLVATSKLLAREGDLAIAEFHLRWPRDYRIVTECVHTRNRMVLARPIEGSIPVYQIQWDIAPAAEGRSQVTLQIVINASSRLLIPGCGRFWNAKRWLRSLGSYLSLFTPAAALPGVDGERILEVIESEEGVRVWMHGKEYTLKS